MNFITGNFTADNKSVKQEALFLSRILKGNIIEYYNTNSVFNANFNLKHNQAPFSYGRGVSSETSSENSELDEKYETYTVDSSFSFSLHLVSGTSSFTAVEGKAYQFGLIVRAGNKEAINKKIVCGFYKPERINKQIKLTNDWQLVLTDEVVNDSTDFNLFTHFSGEGANIPIGGKCDVAMFFVREVD